MVLFQNYITTQRVTFYEKKYETREERQNICLEFACDLNNGVKNSTRSEMFKSVYFTKIQCKQILAFDDVCKKIKDFYNPKLSAEKTNMDDYDFTIVMRLNGPRVFTTDVLKGKTHYLVLFEQ